MSRIYTSIDQLVGQTPLLELTNIERKYGLNAKIMAKLEFLNPAGSIKDRVALNMINQAEKSGQLKAGGTIIEPTSGNTGLGLAMVAAARGYKAIIVMPDTMSKERQIMMKAYGAELLLTPGARGMAGAIAAAEELQKKVPGSIIAGQFVNPDNPAAHYQSTGPEIWQDTDGRVDILVATVGTGGTITGTGRFLKEQKADIKVIAVEPASSAVLSGKAAGSHQIQGIGAGFIPEIMDTSILDEIIPIEDDEAFATGKMLGATEGFLAGISAGAALKAALTVAGRPENSGKNIVVILPDSGDRYLSTKLFA